MILGGFLSRVVLHFAFHFLPSSVFHHGMVQSSLVFLFLCLAIFLLLFLLFSVFLKQNPF